MNPFDEHDMEVRKLKARVATLRGLLPTAIARIEAYLQVAESERHMLSTRQDKLAMAAAYVETLERVHSKRRYRSTHEEVEPSDLSAAS